MKNEEKKVNQPETNEIIDKDLKQINGGLNNIDVKTIDKYEEINDNVFVVN